ncbi:hypothetical protein DKL61_09230 [Gammaproteobacteria bacterium ESL0073]|nr:hypothetical protein DKL61_09230 [Gammaproteobacteria bacterium ESL0073]
MSYKLNVPLSVYQELSAIIYALASKGCAVSLEIRNYTSYGEIFSLVQTDDCQFSPKKSEPFLLSGETEYRPSVQDIIDYKNKLSALLANLEKEAA